MGAASTRTITSPSAGSVTGTSTSESSTVASGVTRVRSSRPVLGVSAAIFFPFV